MDWPNSTERHYDTIYLYLKRDLCRIVSLVYCTVCTEPKMKLKYLKRQNCYAQ